MRYRQNLFISPEKFVNAFDASPEKAAGETDMNNVLFYAMTTDQTRMIALHEDSAKGGGYNLKRTDTSANWSTIAKMSYHYPSVRRSIEGNHITGWYVSESGYSINVHPTSDPEFYNDFNAGRFSLYTYEQVKDQLPSFS